MAKSLEFIETALRIGARFGMSKLIKLELEMGASPYTIDSQGRTPLHFAALTGNLEIVQLLVDYGANTQAVSNSGGTALFYAMANARIDTVNELLANEVKAANVCPSNDLALYLRGTARIKPEKLFVFVSTSRACSRCGSKQTKYVVSTCSILISL
jgi:ankyrin repeat protein